MDENNILFAIKIAITAAAAAFTAAFGWMGWLVLVWVGCMVSDWITGSAAAAHAGQWSSEKARNGIWHKAGMIVVVVVAALADVVLGEVLAHLPMSFPVEYSCLLAPVVLVWYIVTELGSMLENAATMGAPVPKFLIKILAAAKQAAEDAVPDVDVAAEAVADKE